MSPIPTLTVLVIALSASAGTGWYYGYIGEHKEVLALEQQLNTINAQSTRLLNETRAHNAELTASQLIANAEIEQKYHDQIKTNDSLHDQLVDAMRLRRQAANTARGCNSVSKAGDTAGSKKDNAGRRHAGTLDTAGFSENFDSALSGKAFKADKIDAESRLMLDFIKSIPKEMISNAPN
jgi:hypothetical protein